MSVVAEKKTLARPFLKWAGGKGQLLGEIERRLPAALKAGQIDTYVEPFVGGGAVFFRIAQTYTAIKHFYLFEINDDLVNCYNAIKGNVDSVIAELKILNQAFLRKRTRESKKQLFLSIREEFNQEKLSNFGFATVAKLIFLNKTCYNGLYRVNRKGQFNVPFGDYKKPTICDEENLMSASEVLQNAEILCGDFELSQQYINRKTFVYFDPPYRPLSPTASFTSYSKDNFLERDQVRLAEFCTHINKKGAKFLLSNSDPKNEDTVDCFFDEHYAEFHIDTVMAARPINCKSGGRGQIRELIITNY